MSKQPNMAQLGSRIDAALRSIGIDPTKVKKKHHGPKWLLLAWLIPGIPPPGPFG